MRFRLRTLIPRFTIRDLLWITVMVAIPLGYWVRINREMSVRIRKVELEMKQRLDNTKRSAATNAAPSHP